MRSRRTPLHDPCCAVREEARPALQRRFPFIGRFSRAVRVLLAAIVLVAVGAGVVYAVDSAPQEPSYSWYTDNPHAETFSISNGQELRGLANLVNGTASVEDVDVDGDGKPDAPVSFAGKIVNQTGYVNLQSQEFTPIGTPSTPFQGTYNGGRAQGLDIRCLKITQQTSYVGLFGYCGAHAQLNDIYLSDAARLGLEPSRIALEDASTDQVAVDTVMHDIGGIVGYTEGSVAGCESKAPVSVTSNRSAVNAHPVVIFNVGGIAGTVEGSVTGSLYHADLSVTAPSLASDTQDCVVSNIGGIVGTLGAFAQDRLSSQAGEIADCVNGNADDSGLFDIGTWQTTIKVTTTGVGGLDRFGVEKEATSLSVGGIAGYSFGSVRNCVNYGMVNTNSADALLYKDSRGLVHLVDASDPRPQAYPEAADLFAKANGGNGVGGIVGTLRSDGMQAENVERTDAGSESRPITLSDCFNRGMVVGLARTGGIVGSAGSYASIDASRNGKPAVDSVVSPDDCGHVVTTRWNKPMTGGIAGTSSSSISNCSNLSEVENIQTGYYTAGIVGGLSSPVGYTAECYACFNSGQVHVLKNSTQSYREAGIVGNNAGYVRDCVMRSGSVLAHDDDGASYPNAAIGDDSWGMWSNIKFFSSSDLKKSESASVLNAGHAQDVLSLDESQWVYWYISPNGYPTLNRWDAPENRTQLTSANVQAVCLVDAEYVGAKEAVPTLAVTYSYTDSSGARQTRSLVQNVDFYALPQKGATEMTEGATPYRASIIGIGNYAGTVENVCSYGIGPCDLKSCGVSVSAETYNFGAPVYPQEVHVSNPAGVLLDESDFRYEIYSGSTYSLTSATTKNYVVFDSEGYVSWDGGTTLHAVASQRDKLCADLTGVSYTLYNAAGKRIFEVTDDAQRTYDPDTGENVAGTGPVAYKAPREGVTGGGLAGYIVKVSAKEGSKNVKTGSWTSGQYVINPIDLYRGCTIEEVQVEVPSEDGSSTETRTWYWNAEKSMLYEKDAEGNPVLDDDGNLKQASVTFTGGEISPNVTISYTKENGERIVIPNDRLAGYYLIYGDPYTSKTELDYVNRDATPVDDPGAAASEAERERYENLKSHEKAAVTARALFRHYFSNYVHMYFAINPAALSSCTMTVAGSAPAEVGTYAYRGGYAVRPTVKLSLCGNELLAGRDYTVTYENNTEATSTDALAAYYEKGDTSGLASYTVTGLGNVEGSVTGHFIIEPGKSLAEEGFTIAPIADQQENFAHEVRVPGGVRLLDAQGAQASLVEGIDYEVRYQDNVQQGTAKVYVYGINAYTGMLPASFEIVPFDMNDPNNAWRISDMLDKNGTTNWRTEGVSCNDAFSSLNRKVYIVQDWNTLKTTDDVYVWAPIVRQTYVNKETGATYDFYPSVTGSAVTTPLPGSYSLTKVYECGSETVDVTVAKNKVADVASLFSCEPQTYTGEPLEPAVENVPGSFEVTYTNNTEAGVGSYTVTAPYDDVYYEGSYTGGFIINKLDVESAIVTVHDQLYTGSAVEPQVNVEFGGATYVLGRDYTLTYADNVSRGTAKVVVTGIGNCEGTVTASFNIGSRLNIAQAEVAPLPDELHTGSEVRPKPQVTYEGKTLAEGSDYELSYADNVEVSTEKKPASVTITGKGTYAGSSVKATFLIVNVRDIADAECAIAAQPYTGKPCTPSVSVTYRGVILSPDKDYTVEYRSNVKAGALAKAVIKGKGTYEGTLEVPFSIYVKEGTFTEFAQESSSDTLNEGARSDAAGFAVQVAQANYPAGAHGAIVAGERDYAAQLAAASLSQAAGYPVLLTGSQAAPSATLQYLRENAVGMVYVLGDEEAVSADALAAVAAAAGSQASVERVSGSNAGASASSGLALRLADALADCRQQAAQASPVRAVLANPEHIEVAATAAAFAAACGMPLFYTQDDGTLDRETYDALCAYSQVLVAGDVFAVDASVDASIAEKTLVKRIAGNSATTSRYDQSAQVVAWVLSEGCAADGAVVVAAPSLSSHLTVVTLCAKRNVALCVAATQSAATVEALAQASVPAYGVVVVGGSEEFPQALRDAVRAAMGWE